MCYNYINLFITISSDLADFTTVSRPQNDLQTSGIIAGDPVNARSGFHVSLHIHCFPLSKCQLPLKGAQNDGNIQTAVTSQLTARTKHGMKQKSPTH